MTAPLVSVRDLRYDRALQDANAIWSCYVNELQLFPGYIYSLKGDNMSGKTTVLHLLYELFSRQRTARGGLLREEQSERVSSGKLSARTALINGSVGFLSHEDRMFPSLSVFENIWLSTRSQQAIAVRAQLDALIEQLNYSWLNLDRSLQSYSSGAISVIRLLRAHYSGHSILLLDEITGHLDETRSSEFFRALTHFVGESRTAIVVSHLDRHHSLLRSAVESQKLAHSIFTIKRTGDKSCIDLHSSGAS